MHSVSCVRQPARTLLLCKHVSGPKYTPSTVGSARCARTHSAHTRCWCACAPGALARHDTRQCACALGAFARFQKHTTSALARSVHWRVGIMCIALARRRKTGLQRLGDGTPSRSTLSVVLESCVLCLMAPTYHMLYAARVHANRPTRVSMPPLTGRTMLKMCRFMQAGHCERGDFCTFAHHPAEIGRDWQDRNVLYRMVLCKHWARGVVASKNIYLISV